RRLLDSPAVLANLPVRRGRASRLAIACLLACTVLAPRKLAAATRPTPPTAGVATPSEAPSRAGAALAPGIDSATREIVDRTQARYDTTKNFVASFSQELHVASGAQVVRSAGKVYFAKPGRMRWEYTAPEPQTIVGDGTFLWFDQPKDQQVLKVPF